MNSALKSKVSSGADEFELPETLVPVVEDLKKEQQTLKKEIEEVKARPVVRKQDENTKIFNLRQHQMELKIQELEEKKKVSEKELQEILQQKNSTLHTDLRKLAQFILQETRKVSSKIDSVSNIKSELQLIFESNLNDRKKALGMIEDQNKAIGEIGDVIRDTSKVLQGEFHFLTRDIERIQREKEAEMEKLSTLKEEVARHHGIHHVIEERKKELLELEHEITFAEKNALSFARLDEELLTLKAEIQKLQQEKSSLLKETHHLQDNHFHAQENLTRLKQQEAELDHNVSLKKSLLSSLEVEIHEARKRIDSARTHEHEIMSNLQHQREQLTTLQNEISRMESAKATHLLMAEEAQSFYEERKAFLKRELTLIEVGNESRKAEFIAQNELKKAELAAENDARKMKWDTEFRMYSETRQTELKAELESLDRKDLEDIRNKKSILLEEVSKTMSDILLAEGFQSSEDKIRKARKEVEASFELMFGKTRRWKFW